MLCYAAKCREWQDGSATEPTVSRSCLLGSHQVVGRPARVERVAVAEDLVEETREHPAAHAQCNCHVCACVSSHASRRRNRSMLTVGRGPASTLQIVVKVKFSHTRYRALGSELIPVYRQSQW